MTTLSDTPGEGLEPVQDTWFTDRALPIMAMSADVESDRVLKLHFRRPVSDADREALVDALNVYQASLRPPSVASDTAALPSGYEGVKELCTKFFYWWHNQPGTNTQAGFDDWWKVEGEAIAALPSGYEGLVEEIERNIGSEFDGECHLTEETARQIIAALGRVRPVAVKPLEWRKPEDHPKDPDPDDTLFCADGIGGVYAISTRQKIGPAYLLWWAHDPMDWAGFESVAQAKAAAQADYEKRILSALAAPPAPQPLALIEELTAALEPFANGAGKIPVGWPDERAILIGEEHPENPSPHDLLLAFVSDFRLARTVLASAKRFKGE